MVKKVMLQLTPNKLQQKEYPIAHFLIGIPGSGKSTFAKLLSQLGNYQIISTDDIRTELYGDASIQGDWKQIKIEAIQRIYTSLQTGKSIIYDATNFKRALRLEFLQKVKQKLGETHSPVWIGWYLNTPLETSIAWNQNRDRQVPESVIHRMYEILQNFPPVTAEGLTLINTVDVTSSKFSVSEIEKLIKKLPRSIINSQNRKANITLHQYSNFLDFERLLHLISVIIKYPGIGNLQNNNPELLEKILDYKAEFNSDIQEITAIIAKECGNIYACENAINDDLKYLAEVGILPKLTPLSLIRRGDGGEVDLPFKTYTYYQPLKKYNRHKGKIQPKRREELGNRWGSCNSKDDIYFHWRIAMLPHKMIKYIMVHLVQPNHNRDFWNRVERILPDWEERKEWLAKNGAVFTL